MAYFNPNYNRAEVSRSAKFNMGLPYSQTIHAQMMAVDKAFNEGYIGPIINALKTLFRQASPKLLEKEKIQYTNQFAKLSPIFKKINELKEKLKHADAFDETESIKRQISIYRNRTLIVLEDMDMLLRKLLENHKLLIPDQKESASLFE
jgi:hypothetical protein